jgi:pimeloyl-ACP methyl ester carboxylesterase
MQRLHHGDLGLAYREAGAGETVLMLHGSAGSHVLWRRLGITLEGRYRVVAPDLLGYGQSSVLPNGRSFPLEEEIALLRRLLPGDGGAHLVGYSYGGVLALGLALADPQKLSSLTLIEPVAFGILRQTGAAEAFDEVALWRDRFETHSREGRIAAAMREFVDYWSRQGTWDALPDEGRKQVLGIAPKIQLDMRASFNANFDAAALAGLAVPTLLLCGDESPRPTRRVSQQLAKLIGGSELTTIRAAGHDLLLTHTAEINGEIARHIARRSRR